MAFAASLGAATPACSSSSDDPAGTGGSSTGGSSTGGSSAGGSSANGGAGGSSTGGATNASTGGSGPADGGTTGDATKIVGAFTVELSPASASLGTPASTKVIGSVQDGPSPLAVVWEASQTSGECTLSKPRVPFCETSCGADVCVEDDTCQPYPTAKNVGTVTVTGIANGSATSFTMDVVQGNYQPAGVSIAYPGFDHTSTIGVSTSGGDLAPFSIQAPGIDALALKDGAFALESGKAFALAWTAAASGAASRVHVKLDISHHGGSKGMIECDTADSGALEIPAELITKLLGLGAAGYPTVIVTRHTNGTAKTSLGVVELDVTSPVEQAVTVPGLVSCDSDDSACPSGKTCQSDLTCK